MIAHARQLTHRSRSDMRRKTAILAAVGGAVMALVAPVSAAQASASPAAVPAARSCQDWSDINTYGYGCRGYPAGYEMQASAQCKNGRWAYGNIVSISGSSYKWSYAYCAGKGGYKNGTGGYIIFS
jgi:hypothetical protein